MKDSRARNLLIFGVAVFQLLLLLSVRGEKVVKAHFLLIYAAVILSDFILTIIQLRISRRADCGTFQEFSRRWILYIAEKVIIGIIDYVMIRALPLPDRGNGVPGSGRSLAILSYLLLCWGTMLVPAAMSFVIGAGKSAKK